MSARRRGALSFRCRCRIGEGLRSGAERIVRTEDDDGQPVVVRIRYAITLTAVWGRRSMPEALSVVCAAVAYRLC